MAPKVVRIRWRDSVSSHQWTDPSKDALAVDVIESVGFLIEETDDHIAIGMNHDAVKDSLPWSNVTVIPIQAVVEKKVLHG